MTKIKYVEMSDKEFWFTLDRHLPEKEFETKVNSKQGYVLLEKEDMEGNFWNIGKKT